MSVILKGKSVKKVYVREGFLGTELGEVEALKGIDFTVSSGEILGVVGESGSGKSTLAKIICGLENLTSGHLEWNIVSKKKNVHHAQMVFQNPVNSLNPKLSIGYMMKEALASGQSIRISQVKDEDIRRALNEVGLGDVELSRYPHQFSGGQKQRLGIARALALEPGILVCDEPVSALDISIQAQIVNLLIDINRKMDLPIIFIAHDIEVVSIISHNIMVMNNGEVMEYGEAEQIINEPGHKYTKMLMQAVPRNPWISG
ncbi:ABC transporter ATP-binding protein [Elusimicrobiota bacterium]